MDDYFAGSRTQASPPPFSYASPPAQAWGPPVVPPTSSGPSRVLLGLLIGLAALVALGVLAAIAVPVFLDQRDLARSTTVSAPEQVLGLPHLTDATSAAAESRMQLLPGPGDHVGGVYGTGGVRLVVGAARYHLSRSDQEEYLTSAGREASLQGATLSDVEAGRLGGSMRCGASARLPMTICVFADGGSYGVVVVTGPADDPTGMARSAREAFVRRT